MKKDIVQTAKIIFLGAILSLGISFVSAEPWATPAGSPPGSNLGQVLNVMSASQSKDGAFAVGYDVGDEDDDGDYDSDDVDLATGTGVGYKLDVNGATITQGLISQGPIISYGSIFAGVLPLDNSVNVLVGGNVGIGTTSPAESLHIATSGGTIRARGLSEEENPGVAYNAQICADSNGVLILCDSPFNTSLNYDYNEATNECNAVGFTLSVNASGGDAPYSVSWSDTEGGSGTGMSNTYTFSKDEVAPYSVTITATIDDSNAGVAPLTETYATVIPVRPVHDFDGLPCPL